MGHFACEWGKDKLVCVKRKVKVKVKFTLEHTTKAQESRGVALLYSLTSALGGGGWSLPCPGCITPGKDPVPIV